MTGDERYAVDIMKNAYMPDKLKGDMSHDNLDSGLGHAPYTSRPAASSWAGELGKFEDIICDPYVAPLMADDLSGLPEAYMLSCQNDVLRDENHLYLFMCSG